TTGLRSGAVLSGWVASEAPRMALAVPESALVDEDGLSVAFVQISGEVFERRVVQTGVRDGEWVELRSGVRAGERVVTDGAYVIRLISLSGVIPEHSH
ncbi:MAG: efflux RND transporter periplasmic adaptor subunit, partial [Planctomycetota bacterium]|nr:efflux RND transporter periplasmic adaptor subunit [Planctomycetota bacterium]